MYIYLQRQSQSHPTHAWLSAFQAHAQHSVRFPNIHITRPCDPRRHAYCAARFPVIHWPARRREFVAVAVPPNSLNVMGGSPHLAHNLRNPLRSPASVTDAVKMGG